MHFGIISMLNIKQWNYISVVVTLGWLFLQSLQMSLFIPGCNFDTFSPRSVRTEWILFVLCALSEQNRVGGTFFTINKSQLSAYGAPPQTAGALFILFLAYAPETPQVRHCFSSFKTSSDFKQYLFKTSLLLIWSVSLGLSLWGWPWGFSSKNLPWN